MNEVNKAIKNTGIYIFFASLFFFTQLNWAKLHNDYRDIELRLFLSLLSAIVISSLILKLIKWRLRKKTQNELEIEKKVESISLSLFPGVFFILGTISYIFLILGFTAVSVLLYPVFHSQFHYIYSNSKFKKKLDIIKKSVEAYITYIFQNENLDKLDNKKGYHFAFIFIISFLLILIIYPRILFFLHTPMGPTSWELQDPVVSQMNFIPGHSVMRYEIFKNNNLLWSNLRGLGMPLLGNDIQVAPLFPLTMLLFWIPTYYFWNVFVLLRLLLLAIGAYLVAREILKFRTISSLFFMFNFIFSIYVLRWLNHPWQNGLLAGVWYIYVIGKLRDLSFQKFNLKRFVGLLCVIISVYSMVTCGFPEAAAMSAILAALIYSVYFIHYYSKKEIVWGRFLFDLMVGHILGFALSSLQIFSLVEFLNLTSSGYRQIYSLGHYGLAQFSFHDILTYFLSKITSLSNSAPPNPNIHLFGLIPLFLFFVGLFSFFMQVRKIRPSDIVALMCCLFFMLKLFPFWPWFNIAIGSLPVFRETWFTVYFFPLFLWFFAHFAARGIELYSYSNDLYRLKHIRIKHSVLTILMSGLIVTLLFYASPLIGGVQYIELLKTHRNFLSLQVLVIFLVFNAILLYYINANLSQERRNKTKFLLFFLMIAELIVTKPDGFMSLNRFNSIYNPEYTASIISKILNSQGLNHYEMRINDSDGRYLSRGIATPDDGAPAILQERLRRFRTELFVTDWHGYLPLKKPKYPYSWRLISNNLYFERKNELNLVDPFNYTEFDELGYVGGDHFLYYDTDALPRVYIPARCFPSKNIDESAKKVTDVEHFMLGDAFIEELDENEKIMCENFNSAIQEVKIMKDAGSTIYLESIRGPAILVLNDNYYPGWNAIDDITGNYLNIKPANMTFRALILPEDRTYAIKFEYRPEWIKLCEFVISLSIILILYLFFAAVRSKKY